MRRRLVLVAAMVVGLATITAPVVAAAPPEQGSWSNEPFGPYLITNVCPFDFYVSGVTSASWAIFSNPDGTYRGERHLVEQDTFTYGSTTLSGNPYREVWHRTFDSNMNVTSWYVTGGLESVNLPDGSVFWSVGRTNIFASTADFIMTVDSGHSGNLTAFCDALAGTP